MKSKSSNVPGARNVSGRTTALEPIPSLIQRICPSWNSEIIPSKIEAMEIIAEEFNVTSMWTRGNPEGVPFNVSKLEFSLRINIADVKEAGPINSWAQSEGFGKIAETEWNELQELHHTDRRITIQCVSLKYGLPYCGTIRSGYVRLKRRIGKNTETTYLKPVDEAWHTTFDRTFGPMWTS